jgi:hypothetical protein
MLRFQQLSFDIGVIRSDGGMANGKSCFWGIDHAAVNPLSNVDVGGVEASPGKSENLPGPHPGQNR